MILSGAVGVIEKDRERKRRPFKGYTTDVKYKTLRVTMYQLGLHFYHEARGSIFLRNIGGSLPHDMVSYPTRQYSHRRETFRSHWNRVRLYCFRSSDTARCLVIPYTFTGCSCSTPKSAFQSVVEGQTYATRIQYAHMQSRGPLTNNAMNLCSLNSKSLHSQCRN